MYIKEIEINNFKCIKYFKLDLSANTNKIEKDVAIGRFKVFQNKHALPGISILVGRNGIGKTTIINALALISDVISGEINRQLVNLYIRKQVIKKTSMEFLESSLIKDEKIIVDEIINAINSRNGLHYEKYLLSSKEWYINLHKTLSYDLSKSINIKLRFIDDDNDLILNFSINKDGIISFGEINKEIEQKIVDFFKFSMFPIRKYPTSNLKTSAIDFNVIFSQSFYNDKEKDVNMALNSIISILGKDKAQKIIFLSDPTISSINTTTFQNKIIKVSSVYLKNGAEIQPVDFSSGTKEFLFIIEGIIRSMKNKNGSLFLIDEIEVNLHKELVQVILMLLRKIYRENNKQSILTTHNLHFLKPEISNKQIFSLFKDNNENDSNLKCEKLSSFMKEHESIITKYDAGYISPYPNSNFAKNIISEIFDEI